MNAITVPKNPPTAMMGLRTSIGSSPRRSFARSDLLALAVLREQPYRVATKNDAVLGGLHGHPLLVGLRPPADPLRERLAHRPRQDERGADHQGQVNHADSRCPLSHATVPFLEVNLPS